MVNESDAFVLKYFLLQYFLVHFMEKETDGNVI